MVNHNWNDQKFQINLNELEWVNLRSRIEQKNPLCVSFKNLCLKDNNKNVHWVGHSKFKLLEIIDCFKRINSLITYKIV